MGENKKMNKISPVVCAVGKSYVICVPVDCEVLMSAEVDGKTYYCHSNGVRISDTRVQKFTVPSDILNRAKKYKITYEIINERQPYFCDKQAPISVEYNFRPVEKENGINYQTGFAVHSLRVYSFFRRIICH